MVTIVIPVKNEEKYIDNILRSILSQDYPNIERIPVFVADAGSTDKTLEVIQGFSDKLNIQVIKGGLPGVGRNAGAKLANTKYIIFMDADCEFGSKTMLKECIDMMEKKDLWLSAAYLGCKNGGFLDNLFFELSNFSQFLSQFTSPYAVGTFMVFNREKFWELGGFDEKIKYAEDFALSKKIPKNKFGIAKTKAMTTNRRFAKDGHFKILKLFMSTLFNSGNKEFFEKERGYFDN